MKCRTCDVEMLKVKMAGAQFAELMLINREEGLLGREKRSTVSCHVCPDCGHVELVADHPDALRLK